MLYPNHSYFFSHFRGNKLKFKLKDKKNLRANKNNNFFSQNYENDCFHDNPSGGCPFGRRGRGGEDSHRRIFNYH